MVGKRLEARGRSSLLQFSRRITKGPGNFLSYEIYRTGEKIAWYDPFEHPYVPELTSTYPHHKHIPPDIKRHRVPAPEISFEHPNVTALIEAIEREILQLS